MNVFRTVVRESRLVLTTSVVSLLVTASTARAVEYDFVPVSGTQSWDVGTNWTTQPVDDPNFPQFEGDFADLIKDFTGNLFLNLNQPVTIGRLDAGDTTGSQTVLIQPGVGGLNNFLIFDGEASSPAVINTAATGTGNVDISAPVILASDLNIVGGNHPVRIIGPTLDLGGNVLTLGGDNVTHFIGAGVTSLTRVTGAGPIIKNGSSTWAFFGDNTFSGGITLNAGTLVPGRSSAGINDAITEGAFGTGVITIANAGAFTTKVIRPSTAAPSFIIGNRIAVDGDFQIGNAATTTFLNFAGTLTLSGQRVIGAEGGGNLNTISGVIEDGGNGFGITKDGAAVLRLTGVNTYTGETRIRTSSLMVGANVTPGVAGPLGNAVSPIMIGVVGETPGTASVGLRGGADVTIARDIVIANVVTTGSSVLGNDTTQNVTFSGNIDLQRTVGLSSRGATGVVDVTGLVSGVGGVMAIDGGASRLSNANTYTGDTTVRSGRLIVGGNVAPSTNGPLGNSANPIALADAALTTPHTATLEIGGAFEISRGIVVHSNANATAVLSASNAASTVALYSGPITLNRGVVFGNATAGATTRVTGHISDGAGAFGVTINGAGTVEFAHTTAHAYDGLTTIASGQLLLNASANAGAGGIAILGNISLTGGELTWSADHQVADSAVITMSGGILNLAGRTETVADLVYTGGAIVNAGNLTVSGGTDLFLFDGAVRDTPTTLTRNLLYIGATTGAQVTAPLRLPVGTPHSFAVNDGASAIDLEITAEIANDTEASTFTKTGQGVLRLTAPNTFGGFGQSLGLAGGALAVTNDNQLGQSGTSLAFSGGYLRFDAPFTLARTLNLSASGGGIETPLGISITIGSESQIVGPGIFAKRGAGTLLLTADRSGTWTDGSISLEGGVLEISAENQLGAAANDITFNGGTLRITSGFVATLGKVITTGAAGGSLEVFPGQTLALNSDGQLAGSGALAITGGGNVVVAGANADLASGARKIVRNGRLELRHAQALGNTNKAAITLEGGTLALTADAATTFGNAITVTGNATVESNTATVGAAGVLHTVGALSVGANTLTVNAGANVGSGLAIFRTTSTTFTGNATINVGAGAQYEGVTLNYGANTATFGGAGVAFFSGALTGSGPIVKNDSGILSVGGASTGSAPVTVNGGALRASNTTAFGTSTITLNNGALLSLNAANVANNVVVNNGIVQPAGNAAGKRFYNGAIDVPGTLEVRLFDHLNPTVDQDISFGGAGVGGSITGNGNIIVIANPSNATGLKKFRMENASGIGSFNGVVTVNQHAIFQIRSLGFGNNLGSALLRLNTGVNLTSPDLAGRVEFIAEQDAEFGTNVELIGDSTIGVGRGTTVSNHLLKIGNLDLGAANNFAVAEVSGQVNYRLEVAGTTTFRKDVTITTQGTANTTLNNLVEVGGSFNVTKLGAASLILNNKAWTGSTTIQAGTLRLNVPESLSNTHTVTIAAGASLNLGGISETIGNLVSDGNVVGPGTLTTTGITATGGSYSVALAGTGGLTKTGTGALVLSGVNTFTGDIFANGGPFNLATNDAIPDAANVFVNGSQFAFANGGNTSTSETLANLTLNSGAIRTTSGLPVSPSFVTVTGTLNVAGGDFALNSGSSLSAQKVIFGGNVQNVHVIGGNTPLQVTELIVGPGGLEFTGTNLRMNQGDDDTRQGARVVLNGDVKSFASVNEAGIFGASGAGTFGVRQIQLNGTRIFTTEDGAAGNDLRVDFELSGNGDLVKDGPGTLLLAGVNTYTGSTRVNAGSLVVTGSIAGSVNAGVAGTLVGTGSVGDVTAEAGGTIGAGPGIGTFTTGSLTMQAGSRLSLQIDTNALGSDRINVQGAFTLDTGVAPELLLSDLGSTILVGGEIFQLVTYASGWNGGFFRYQGSTILDGDNIVVGSNLFTVDYDDTSSLTLIAVPEPTTVAALFSGAAFLLSARRRRRCC